MWTYVQNMVSPNPFIALPCVIVQRVGNIFAITLELFRISKPLRGFGTVCSPNEGFKRFGEPDALNCSEPQQNLERRTARKVKAVVSPSPVKDWYAYHIQSFGDLLAISLDILPTLRLLARPWHAEKVQKCRWITSRLSDASRLKNCSSDTMVWTCCSFYSFWEVSTHEVRQTSSKPCFGEPSGAATLCSLDNMPKLWP